MEQCNKIAEYLEAVRQQIRWKKAQSVVLEEIKNHITDQKNSFLNNGFNEEEATDKAIAQMGDPILIGEQLDRAHRPNLDWPLLVMTATILLLGLASQILIGLNQDNNGAGMFQRQIIWAGIAIIVMVATYFIDFTIIGKFPYAIFFGLCAIMIVDYLFTRVTRVNLESIYAINLMLLFPTAYAGFVYRMRDKGYSGFILCGITLIIPACLSILVPGGPNETVFFLLCTSCFIILTAAVAEGWFNIRKLFAVFIMYIPITGILITLFFMIRGDGYVAKRAQIMLNPPLDPTGFGYIGTMIQRFLFHSQFIGKGLPISDYGVNISSQLLPAVNTDFLLTYLIYRFGWIVLIGTIMIFSAFVIRAVLLCKKQKSVLGFLVSLAIISTFALQCAIYIISNLGLFVFSPLSLPLISYGGQSLVINMCLIGCLLSVFRTGDLFKDKNELANSSHHDIRQLIISKKLHY